MAAQVIESGVVGDLENPRCKAQAHIEGLQAAEDLHEGFLRQVFRRGGVLHHANDQVEDGALVAADDLAGGELMPGERLRDDLHVRRGGEVGSFQWQRRDGYGSHALRPVGRAAPRTKFPSTRRQAATQCPRASMLRTAAAP